MACSIVWRILVVLGIDCRFHEVKERSYWDLGKYTPLDLTHTTNESLPDILDLLKEEYREESDRREHVNRKASFLLAGVAILAPLVGSFVEKQTGLLLVLNLIPLLALGTVVLLLLWHFGVDRWTQPSVTPDLITSSSTRGRLAELIKQYHRVNAENYLRNCFRVDVYRASNRMSGLAAILVLMFFVGLVLAGFLH